MIPADEALERLLAGNRRFVAGEGLRGEHGAAARREQLVSGQAPFAVVLGCSDSRVPAELVFDQGLGDLFVVRVAGNVAAPSQVGSVEFAVECFGTPLVMVLGHTRCGAVQATLDELAHPSAERSPNLASIVERIRPAVEGRADAHDAVRANVRWSVALLSESSALLDARVASDDLRIVGAEYSLETGAVELLDTDERGA